MNEFAIKWCKRFPPHLNNVSTLSCEIWNAHSARATIELSEKETPEFVRPQLWPPNSPELNLVDYSVCGLPQKKVYKTRFTDLDEMKQRLRTEWTKPDHVVIAQSFVSGFVAYQRVSRLVVDILSTVSDFRHCTLNDFLLQILTTWTVTRCF